MPNPKPWKCLASLCAPVLFLLPLPCGAADLTVTVEGLSGHGKVILGLYRSQDPWPDGQAPRQVEIPAAPGQIVYVFKDLPPGRYAVNGFYDENGNGKMDYSFIGIPKEGFVFSNDRSPKLSAPKFDACAIAVADAPVAITVHIQHWNL